MTVTLSPREAVADALHRAVLGIDSNNYTLFSSACLQTEEMLWIGGGFHIAGWPAIKQLFNKLFTMVTTHTITNIRIDLEEGASEAHLTAHAMSYHIRPEDAFAEEDTSYTASSLYDIGLVRGEEGSWRIKKWEAKVLWTKGNRSIIHG